VANIWLHSSSINAITTNELNRSQLQQQRIYNMFRQRSVYMSHQHQSNWIPMRPFLQLPGSSGNNFAHITPAAIAPKIGPIKCSAWKFHWPDVWPCTYQRAYNAAGLNMLPRSGTLTIINSKMGRDNKYAGNLLTSNSSGTAITVQMYAQVTEDSLMRPCSQNCES
jgi:hypothetical protein